MQVAGSLVDESESGGNGSCHWLDYGTEHPHRIALSVREDRLNYIVQNLENGFINQGLQVSHSLPFQPICVPKQFSRCFLPLSF